MAHCLVKVKGEMDRLHGPILCQVPHAQVEDSPQDGESIQVHITLGIGKNII